MSEDDSEITPRPEIWEKGIIVLAALLTIAAVLAVYFLANIPAGKPHPQPAQVEAAPAPSDEVEVGIAPAKPVAGH